MMRVPTEVLDTRACMFALADAVRSASVADIVRYRLVLEHVAPRNREVRRLLRQSAGVLETLMALSRGPAS